MKWFVQPQHLVELPHLEGYLVSLVEIVPALLQKEEDSHVSSGMNQGVTSADACATPSALRQVAGCNFSERCNAFLAGTRRIIDNAVKADILFTTYA